MGCGCGGGGNASSNKTSNATPVLKLQTKKEDCTITKEAIGNISKVFSTR